MLPHQNKCGEIRLSTISTRVSIDEIQMKAFISVGDDKYKSYCCVDLFGGFDPWQINYYVDKVRASDAESRTHQKFT